MIAVPAKGSSGRVWQYKAKGDGLLLVRIKDLGPAIPGSYRVKVKAKHWFTSAAADQPAASTSFAISIGGECFTRVVTKKS